MDKPVDPQSNDIPANNIPKNAESERGVCYFSTIPPFMDADLLRRML